jgi:hypothetical protein
VPFLAIVELKAYDEGRRAVLAFKCRVQLFNFTTAPSAAIINLESPFRGEERCQPVAIYASQEIYTISRGHFYAFLP